MNDVIRRRRRRDPIERFRERLKTMPSGCIEWQGSRRPPYGYGTFYFEGRHEGAHRFAWAIANGPIPPGLCILHRCDNPPCVNPDHLFLGTHADNAADRVAKGRAVPPPLHRGAGQWNARLTEDDVVAIRADQRVQRLIAEDYGIDQTAVSLIKRRKNWRHVA